MTTYKFIITSQEDGEAWMDSVEAFNRKQANTLIRARYTEDSAVYIEAA